MKMLQNIPLGKKQLLIIGAVVLVLVVGIILYRRHQKRKALALSQAAPTPTAPQGQEADKTLPMLDDSFPLQLGSRGRRVEQLQLYMRDKLGAKFTQYGVDGIFGTETAQNARKLLKVSKVNEELFKEKRMTDFTTFKYPVVKEATA